MKIFIIGPEGSGKTVMLAMLSRYVTTERTDLVLEPADYETSLYVVAAQALLAKGEWPPSTLQGALTTLQWRFGLRGALLHEIVMFDAAGQDLRQILLQNNWAGLTEQQCKLSAQIDLADVLVYLLDLNGFIASKDPMVINENAWLFKTFMTRQNWREKRRLVVLSKADTFRAMLESKDVRDVVKCNLPRGFDHLVEQESTVEYFALASVMTKTVIDSNGNPMRIPDGGLKQSGLPEFVEALQKAIEIGVHPPPPPPVGLVRRMVKGAVYGGLVGSSIGYYNSRNFSVTLTLWAGGALIGALIRAMLFYNSKPNTPFGAVVGAVCGAIAGAIIAVAFGVESGGLVCGAAMIGGQSGHILARIVCDWSK